jgi:hypothetical protein
MTASPISIPFSVATTLLLCLALGGCASQGADEGNFGLYIKDAPVDQYERLLVTITRAEVLPARGSDWTTAFDGEKAVDLLALRAAEAKERLAELGLPAGRYNGLRLAFADVVGVRHNGTEERLVVAGNVLTVLESFEIAAGADLSLLLDLDAQASTNEAGLFTPRALSIATAARAQDLHTDRAVRKDAPQQQLGNLFGLCTAWIASADPRGHGNGSANAIAFERLSQNATAAGQTLEEFCDAQPFPGRASAMPEHARQARQAAQDRRPDAGGGAARPDGAAAGGSQNQTVPPTRRGP